MKKTLFILTLLVFAGSGINAQTQIKNKITGNWKYEVPQAPYGYDTGNISFVEKENKLSGVVNFSSGYSVNLQNVTLRNDTLRANVNVEGESVNILAIVSKSNLSGTVDTSMGKMNLKAEKLGKTPHK